MEIESILSLYLLPHCNLSKNVYIQHWQSYSHNPELEFNRLSVILESFDDLFVDIPSGDTGLGAKSCGSPRIGRTGSRRLERQARTPEASDEAWADDDGPPQRRFQDLAGGCVLNVSCKTQTSHI